MLEIRCTRCDRAGRRRVSRLGAAMSRDWFSAFARKRNTTSSECRATWATRATDAQEAQKIAVYPVAQSVAQTDASWATRATNPNPVARVAQPLPKDTQTRATPETVENCGSPRSVARVAHVAHVAHDLDTESFGVVVNPPRKLGNIGVDTHIHGIMMQDRTPVEKNTVAAHFVDQVLGDHDLMGDTRNNPPRSIFEPHPEGVTRMNIGKSGIMGRRDIQYSRRLLHMPHPIGQVVVDVKG